MRHTAIITICLFAGLSQLATAQDAPKLVLETSPTQTEIELEGSVTIGSDGSISATPVDVSVCQTSGNCEGVTVAVTEFGFAGTDSRALTVDEGDTVELNWRSSGATTCQPISTFPAWRDKAFVKTDSRDATLAQRSVDTTDSAASGAYELKLQCANGSVTSTIDASSTLSLTVNEVVAPSPTSCEGRDPISGWTQLTTGSLSCLFGDFSADCRSWSPNLWPNPFVETGSLTRKILTNRSAKRQYVAIEFSTKGLSSTADGRFNFTSAGGVIRQEPLIVTISKCPGDFNPDQPSGCYFTPTFSFKWRAPQSLDSANCVLEPNSTYYLNMLSSSSPAGTVPSKIEPVEECDNSLCGILIQKN